ncbi:hypothetical protein BGZ65_010880 [Modicella reniformis]|uniref:Ribosome-assembly protein 3 C-terminal domain-containing protein n=1 Tax=Modicella reniformis TaxID=1440133 RepID=A0A9P6M2G6_9FUNG|nr:hypothetical protein BGZ65_010880 [Modicella reniformis]
MGSKSKSTLSKRTITSSEPQDLAAPVSKRSKKSQDEVSTRSDHDAEATDMDMDTRAEHLRKGDNDVDEEDDGDDIDMQGDDRESSDEESDVEDDEDQELKAANAATISKRKAHTSDWIQRTLSDPEIERAFHDQYMTQITQAFGDELNTLRETDSLEGPHLELLIDSLNQTGHIYSAVERALWVAEDGQSQQE